ncbi:hypothetical protein LIER_22433 [Lithospermum erythrorhizon]|uniref:Peptidase A2 domain-containing protein n=1 Tax=Lithospermum erythrorhizon TaxID=34254 RepID=A0AAV3QU15_LITER
MRFSDKELVGLELLRRMLVDTGSTVDILYLRAYDKHGLSRKHLKPVATPLTGFTGQSIHPIGIADLDVTVGKGSRMVTVRAFFWVVDIADPSYNGLIGRPLLTALRAIVSPLHLKNVIICPFPEDCQKGNLPKENDTKRNTQG